MRTSSRRTSGRTSIRRGRFDVDVLARQLALFGDIACAMPPAWRGAGISHPFCGPEGQTIGRILPGEGLYLDCDLKSLGIRKPIRGVVERSPMRRWLDWAMGEAAAITSMAGVQAAVLSGKSQTVIGLPTGFASAPTLGRVGIGNSPFPWWCDCFPSSGNNFNVNYAAGPNGGTLNQATTTTSTVVPTAPYAGWLSPNITAPTGTDTAYLLTFGINNQIGSETTPNGASCYILADLLVGNGQNPAGTTSTQTLTPPALTRYTSGAGVLCFFEPDCSSNAGGSGTAAAITLGYTNQAGVAGQSTVGFASAGVDQNTSVNTNTTSLISYPFFPLAAGDYGIQAATSYSLASAWTPTPATCDLVLYYPLAFIAGTTSSDDYQEYDLTSKIYGILPLATDASGYLGFLSLFTLLPNNNEPTQSVILLRTVRG